MVATESKVNDEADDLLEQVPRLLDVALLIVLSAYDVQPYKLHDSISNFGCVLEAHY